MALVAMNERYNNKNIKNPIQKFYHQLCKMQDKRKQIIAQHKGKQVPSSK